VPCIRLSDKTPGGGRASSLRRILSATRLILLSSSILLSYSFILYVSKACVYTLVRVSTFLRSNCNTLLAVEITCCLHTLPPQTGQLHSHRMTWDLLRSYLTETILSPDFCCQDRVSSDLWQPRTT
jgi:hypothetical protein